MTKLTILSALMLCLAGCGQSPDGGPAVPRLKAYPRVEVADSAYSVVAGLPMSMQVNTAAVATMEQREAARWVNVAYPANDVAIYLTFTPVTVATVDDVVDNRVERMALNLSGNDAEMLQFDTPDGLSAQVVTSWAISTPVQFIATDNRTIVVSGAAFVEKLSASTRDSLRPVVEMLQRDLIHTIKTLKK
jgi:hypothetical protein